MAPGQLMRARFAPQRWSSAGEPERGVGAKGVAVTLVQVAGARAGGLEVGGHAVAVEVLVPCAQQRGAASLALAAGGDGKDRMG